MHEKYFQMTNAVDTLPLTHEALGRGLFRGVPDEKSNDKR